MSKPALILDIETRPDPWIDSNPEWWTSFEEALKPPANIKDELKLEDWRTKAMAKARAGMALNARTGCIAMVGLDHMDDDIDDTEEVFRCKDVVDREQEAQALRKFASWIDGGPPQVIVGWNVRRFDVPFLLARCAIHGIALPPWFPTLRTYRDHLVDLFADIYGDGPLTEWRYVFGGGFKDVEGADLLDVPLDELEAHLRDDLHDTRQLAEACAWAWRK